MVAPVKSARGVKLVLKVGDGASPEQFVQMCSINAERGITFSSTLNEEEIVDCEDPDALAWIVREKTGLSMSFRGAGMLNTPDVPDFFEWYQSEESRNALIILDVPADDGGVIWSARLHLGEFSITGNRGGKAQFDGSFSSDGVVEMAPNT